jgi:hypothetical protein
MRIITQKEIYANRTRILLENLRRRMYAVQFKTGAPGRIKYNKKVLREAAENGEIDLVTRVKIMGYIGQIKQVLNQDIDFRSVYQRAKITAL